MKTILVLAVLLAVVPSVSAGQISTPAVVELTRIQIVSVDNHKAGIPFVQQSFISHMTVNGDDGKQYQIRCAAHVIGQHCLNGGEGVTTPARLEDNTTMVITFRDTGNHNKPRTVKYDILSSMAMSDVSVGGNVVPVVPSTPTEILRVSKEWSVGGHYVVNVTMATGVVVKQTVTVLRVATFDDWLAEFTKKGLEPSPPQLALARSPSARFYEVNGWLK